MPEQPLILTLRINDESQAFFDEQRQLYFPPERNFLAAHLMLFHQLPAEAATYDFLAGITHETFDVTVSGLMNLGAGVAYRVQSKELNSLHQLLSRHFQPVLIPQDRQGFRPHITVINKTTPERTRALIAQLSADFEPFQVKVTGLDLWTYLGGPWRHECTILFS